MQKLGGIGILRKTKLMFPSLKMVNYGNIDKWIRDKIKPINSANDLAKFLKANQPTYKGLTSDMIDHLLVYEHSITQEAKNASERLTRLFYCAEDKGKFSLQIVQVSI